jgi:CRISPR-associated protein Cas2
VNRSLYVITYDVCDNRKRRLLARELEGIGIRVQESVFETFVSPGDIRKIISKSSSFINTANNNDSLRVYRICASCTGHFRNIGGFVVDWKQDIII